MSEQDVRWKQRYSNYEKALDKLADVVETRAPDELSELEKEGVIQRFEYTQELAWKVMKDYLEYQGITGLTGSRDAFREAFQKEIIEDGEAWMETIKSRNKTSHLYDEITAAEIVDSIFNVYIYLFRSFSKKMKSLL
ncbi:nucleotidyltransferase substrate binding protein [Gracilimonas mengyeensis]|uniref:Nucleotidyltransferase substrate binding protein, HI0074 family n=1 Tax=Gracilimonas mengyeensis TaxID=1302730 RepID=A0A521FGR4_9BACT|nr:nucleotidyltransferase substrate binding protein [Gracilimonas mengyeensis]SMO94841.1 nucleotidyltransferase substrate binding protein, HI0074 family [Gracilimonas mengyeensis]